MKPVRPSSFPTMATENATPHSARWTGLLPPLPLRIPTIWLSYGTRTWPMNWWSPRSQLRVLNQLTPFVICELWPRSVRLLISSCTGILSPSCAYQPSFTVHPVFSTRITNISTGCTTVPRKCSNALPTWSFSEPARKGCSHVNPRVSVDERK